MTRLRHTLLRCVVQWVVFVACLVGAAAGAQAQHKGSSSPATPPGGWQVNTPAALPPGGKDGVASGDAKARPVATNVSGVVPLAATASAAPEIVALAQSLKNDPDLIFEYVYQNIEYIPSWNSKKGAVGTLVDGRGNEFDQASLLVSLLRAAGFTDASYQIGAIELTAAQLGSWLGTGNDICAGSFIILNGGAPAPSTISAINSQIVCNSSASVIDLAHIWVSVTVNGQARALDPSLKQYSRKAGLTASQLAAAMGYAQSTLISDAETGAAITSNSAYASVQGLNRTKVRSDLAGYAGALVAYMKAQPTPLAVSDIIGGQSIVPIGKQTAATNPYQKSGTSVTTLTEIPCQATCYRTTLTLTLPGASALTFYSDEIYGHRLSVFFNSSNQPVLYLDGVAQATGTAATVNSPNVTIMAAVAHNYPTKPYQDQTLSLTVSLGGSYVIATGWDQVGRGMIERHRKLLAQNSAGGVDPSSEPVLGESLSMLGYSWLAEYAREQQMTDQIAGTTLVLHHAVGIVAQRQVQSVTGPVVDLPMDNMSISSRSSAGAGGKTAAVFLADAGAGSAFESGVIEQAQAAVGLNAVSTTKLLDVAVQNGDTIYDVNNGNTLTTTNYYNSTLRGLLASNGWGVQDLSRVDGEVNGGNRLILPLSGSIHQGQWVGVGYQSVTQAGTSVAEIISGGLSGGESTATVATPTVVANSGAALTPSGTSNDVPAVTGSGGLASPVTKTIGDPVNNFTGDYQYTHSDITVGSGSFPYALGFQRSYNSGAALHDGPLGKGWTHNFNISARTDSDAFEGMGENSAVNAAASIASLYVAYDLLSTNTNLDHMVLAALTQRWFMDQLYNNAVAIAQPNSSEHFIKLADNSYNAPLGSASTVTTGTGTDGTGTFTTYTYKTKDGVALAFNSRSGLISSWTHPNGMQLTFTYGSSNLLQTVSNNLGWMLQLCYNGNLISQVRVDTNCSSSGGFNVIYGYDSNDNLTASSDPLRNVTTFSYGTPGQLTQIFYPSNPSTAFVTNSYDGLGKVYQQTDALGHLTQVHIAGYRAEIDDPLGNQHVLYNGLHGQVLCEVQVLNPSGAGTILLSTVQANGYCPPQINQTQNSTVNTYDAFDRLLSTVAPEGNSVAYQYDSKNNVTQVTTTAKPSVGGTVTQRFAYEATYSKLQSIIDGNGYETDYVYDTAAMGNPGNTGNLLSMTLPAVPKPGVSGTVRSTRQYQYNAHGQLTDSFDEEGRHTHYGYDSSGNRTSVVVDADHLALTTTYGYNSVGDVTSVIDPRGSALGNPSGYTIVFVYDGKRRLTQTYPNALPVFTDYAYDPDDRQTKFTKEYWNGCGYVCALETTSTVYTKSGKPQTVTDPSGVVTTYSYDGDDRVSNVTTSSGRNVLYTYDAASRIATISDTVSGALDSSITVNLGSVLRETRTYSPNGRLASSTDARNNVTNYSYDGFDRPKTTTYPGGISEGSNQYDSNGNLLQATTRQGNTVSYQYDALNRPVTKTVQGNGSAPSATYNYGYDYSGRKLQALVSSDPFNASCPGTSFSAPCFGYDTAGRQVSETRFDGKTVAYTLDAAGNQTGLVWPETGSLAYQVTYVYDPINQLTDIYEGAGTSGLRLAHFLYNTLSERYELDYGNGATTTYTYEANGLVHSIQHNFSSSTLSFTYTHNTENRISATAISDTTFSPGSSNPDFSPATLSYTANQLNQYSAVGGVSYSYDTNGNLTSSGAFTYQYDALNRLVSAAQSSGTSTYGYDSLGRRASKTVGTVKTAYLSSGDREISDYDGTSGSLLRRYVYGPGLDEPVVTIDASGVHSYLHADGLGSVVAVTDSTKTVTEKHVYTPFGISDTTTGSAFQFAGRRMDADTGLYYYRARYYSPTLGRFLQPDPIGTAGGLNLYAYVGNDPLNGTDPMGLWQINANLLIVGISVGEYTAPGSSITVPYSIARVGFTGVGINYDPSKNPSSAPAIAPLLSNGGLPSGVTSMNWQGRTGSLGLTAGPLSGDLADYSGNTYVTEKNNGTTVGQILIPGEGLGAGKDGLFQFGLPTEKKVGASLDAQYDYEFGVTGTPFQNSEPQQTTNSGDGGRS